MTAILHRDTTYRLPIGDKDMERDRLLSNFISQLTEQNGQLLASLQRSADAAREELNEQQIAELKDDMYMFHRVLYDSYIFRCLVSKQFYIIRAQKMYREAMKTCDSRITQLRELRNKLQVEYNELNNEYRGVITALKNSILTSNARNVEESGSLQLFKHQLSDIILKRKSKEAEMLRIHNNIKKLFNLKSGIQDLDESQIEYPILNTLSSLNNEKLESIIEANKEKFDVLKDRFISNGNKQVDEISGNQGFGSEVDEALGGAHSEDSEIQTIISELNHQILVERDRSLRSGIPSTKV